MSAPNSFIGYTKSIIKFIFIFLIIFFFPFFSIIYILMIDIYYDDMMLNKSTTLENDKVRLIRSMSMGLLYFSLS